MDWEDAEREAEARLRPGLVEHRRLVARARELGAAAIEAVATASPLGLSAQVQARLLVRIISDLRVIEKAVLGSYILQAYALLASMFEHAHVVAYIGTSESRANEWLSHAQQHRTFHRRSAARLVPPLHFWDWMNPPFRRK